MPQLPQNQHKNVAYLPGNFRGRPPDPPRTPPRSPTQQRGSGTGSAGEEGIHPACADDQ